MPNERSVITDEDFLFDDDSFEGTSDSDDGVNVSGEDEGIDSQSDRGEYSTDDDQYNIIHGEFKPLDVKDVTDKTRFNIYNCNVIVRAQGQVIMFPELFINIINTDTKITDSTLHEIYTNSPDIYRGRLNMVRELDIKSVDNFYKKQTEIDTLLSKNEIYRISLLCTTPSVSSLFSNYNQFCKKQKLTDSDFERIINLFDKYYIPEQLILIIANYNNDLRYGGEKILWKILYNFLSMLSGDDATIKKFKDNVSNKLCEFLLDDDCKQLFEKNIVSVEYLTSVNSKNLLEILIRNLPIDRLKFYNKGLNFDPYNLIVTLYQMNIPYEKLLEIDLINNYSKILIDNFDEHDVPTLDKMNFFGKYASDIIKLDNKKLMINLVTKTAGFNEIPEFVEYYKCIMLKNTKNFEIFVPSLINIWFDEYVIKKDVLNKKILKKILNTVIHLIKNNGYDMASRIINYVYNKYSNKELLLSPDLNPLVHIIDTFNMKYFEEKKGGFIDMVIIKNNDLVNKTHVKNNEVISNVLIHYFQNNIPLQYILHIFNNKYVTRSLLANIYKWYINILTNTPDEPIEEHKLITSITQYTASHKHHMFLQKKSIMKLYVSTYPKLQDVLNLYNLNLNLYNNDILSDYVIKCIVDNNIVLYNRDVTCNKYTKIIVNNVNLVDRLKLLLDKKCINKEDIPNIINKKRINVKDAIKISQYFGINKYIFKLIKKQSIFDDEFIKEYNNFNEYEKTYLVQYLYNNIDLTITRLKYILYYDIPLECVNMDNLTIRKMSEKLEELLNIMYTKYKKDSTNVTLKNIYIKLLNKIHEKALLLNNLNSSIKIHPLKELHEMFLKYYTVEQCITLFGTDIYHLIKNTSDIYNPIIICALLKCIVNENTFVLERELLELTENIKVYECKLTNEQYITLAKEYMNFSFYDKCNIMIVKIFGKLKRIIGNKNCCLDDCTSQIILSKFNIPAMPFNDVHEIEADALYPLSVFTDIHNKLKNNPEAMIKKKTKNIFSCSWSIQYVNSIGHDDGGVSREYVRKCIDFCLNSGMLVLSDDRKTYVFSSKNQEIDIIIYKYLGMFFCKNILYDKISLGIMLHPALTINICCNSVPKFTILQSILNMEMYELMDFKRYELMWESKMAGEKFVSIIDKYDNKYYDITNLNGIDDKSNNHTMVLNDENDVDKFIMYKIKFELYVQLLKYGVDVNNKFIEGFKFILGDIICGPDALFNSIKGNINYDITKILDIIDYEDTATKEFKKHVNDVIIELNSEDKQFSKNLLNFWYGSHILPEPLKINPKILFINPDDKLKNKTPIRSQTCFFTLLIPLYTVDEKLTAEHKSSCIDTYVILSHKDLIKWVIKKRLVESINGYLLMEKSGDGFNLV
jgi:hypothetical protein